MVGRVLERGVGVPRVTTEVDEPRLGIPGAEDVELREMARRLLAKALLAPAFHAQAEERVEERSDAPVGRGEAPQDRVARDPLGRGIAHAIEERRRLRVARQPPRRGVGADEVQEARFEVDRKARMAVEHLRQERRSRAPDAEHEDGTRR